MRFLTAPDSVEYVQDNGFRERLGAVTNRTYRTWRNAKLTLMVRFPNRTGSYEETLDKANPKNPSILFQTDVFDILDIMTF